MTLKKRLERLEAEVPSETEYPPPEEWPIEQWTQEELAHCDGPALYYIEDKSIEEVLVEDMQFHASPLLFSLTLRAYETYQVSGVHPIYGGWPEFSREVIARIWTIVEPHMEFCRGRLEETEESRERKRLMHLDWQARQANTCGSVLHR